MASWNSQGFVLPSSLDMIEYKKGGNSTCQVPHTLHDLLEYSKWVFSKLTLFSQETLLPFSLSARRSRRQPIILNLRFICLKINSLEPISQLAPINILPLTSVTLSSAVFLGIVFYFVTLLEVFLIGLSQCCLRNTLLMQPV